MNVSKIQVLKNNLIKTYRNNKLYKDTPQILRDIYINRQGSVSELKNKYGKENVENRFVCGYISSKSGNNWKITNTGKKDIEIFYSKPSLWESLVSIQFALLAKIFK